MALTALAVLSSTWWRKLSFLSNQISTHLSRFPVDPHVFEAQCHLMHFRHPVFSRYKALPTAAAFLGGDGYQELLSVEEKNVGGSVAHGYVNARFDA